MLELANPLSKTINVLKGQQCSILTLGCTLQRCFCRRAAHCERACLSCADGRVHLISRQDGICELPFQELLRALQTGDSAFGLLHLSEGPDKCSHALVW